MPGTEPQFQQIADTLRGEIESGQYPPGSLMPTQAEVAERFGVSKVTANAAIRVLRAEGKVRIAFGRGAEVVNVPVITREAARRQKIRADNGARGAFDAEIRAAGMTPNSQTTPSEVPAPADVAAILGTEPGAPVLARSRRMYADGIPMQLATSWLPLDLAAGTQIAQEDSGPGGIYSRLDELGHGPVEFNETIVLRLPDDNERRFLSLDIEQRIYHLRRIARDTTGRVVEICDTFMPAHQWILSYTWRDEP
jgi:GntR family transcriptional regulator